jgi:hypothetical protein
MILDPKAFYFFSFDDAEGNTLSGGYERAAPALAYAEANRLTAYALAGGSFTRVDQSPKP